jgi:hypothetical protein
MLDAGNLELECETIKLANAPLKITRSGQGQYVFLYNHHVQWRTQEIPKGGKRPLPSFSSFSIPSFPSPPFPSPLPLSFFLSLPFHLPIPFPSFPSP